MSTPDLTSKFYTDTSAQGTFDAGVRLTARARRHLRSFVEQFLDSSFNPLFLAVRRAIEREASRVLPQQHMQQYLYLISWFLRAECARRKKQSADRANRARMTQTEIESFALVATVLNQETFVLLNRSMQTALDDKKWQDLNAGMKCFTQIVSNTQSCLDKRCASTDPVVAFDGAGNVRVASG